MLRIGTPHRVRDTGSNRTAHPHKAKTAGSRDPAVLKSRKLTS
jgi:hypothetical protein